MSAIFISSVVLFFGLTSLYPVLNQLSYCILCDLSLFRWFPSEFVLFAPACFVRTQLSAIFAVVCGLEFISCFHIRYLKLFQICRLKSVVSPLTHILTQSITMCYGRRCVRHGMSAATGNPEPTPNPANTSVAFAC